MIDGTCPKDTDLNIDVGTILAEVRANSARLRSCKRHTFAGPWPPSMLARVTCSHCGGEMKKFDVHHYRDGYVAHGGDATDITPDWET